MYYLIISYKNLQLQTSCGKKNNTHKITSITFTRVVKKVYILLEFLIHFRIVMVKKKEQNKDQIKTTATS